MHSLSSVWRQRSRRAKVALVALPILCLVLAGSAAAATRFFSPNPLNPSEQDAAKIVGIQQLVATYVTDLDWGPTENGIFDPNAIGDLFTPDGNWAVMYWNAWTPQHPGCQMSINNSPTSVATLAAMGHSSLLQGRLISS